ERALWLEMAAPRPRADGSDTFFLGAAPEGAAEELDVRNPLNRNLFLLTEGEMDLDRLKRGLAIGAPTVSASMATAVLAYSGIAVKMLVDQRLDAQLHTMFMVAYQPGALVHPHDHPFEESYYILEGEVDVVADADLYLGIYRQMLLIRGFEELVQSLFLKGEVYGTTHLYSGQEAVATGIAGLLEERDRVAATYRGHGHALALGVDPQKLLDEMLARESGINGGRAGSMNVNSPADRLIGSFGIV